ncbi:MAG: 2-isopropylmalate synthase [Defluviitaleaceae bacterium]|nr:2-isopropylmalate synthase [Defluviitaleaceae bacterium]MCL2263827.1 2-isopropylmalate synthase [Defluviitaleaceae bacterium]
MNYKKYRAGEILDFPTRTWPNKRQTTAPAWCSVDLRDGNQSLVTPLTMEQKLEFFKYLVQIGFKEIEIGFPAASDGEFQFVRTLIQQKLIPDDVTIQVLTQSREPIIRRTFESLRGVKRATVHLYNATSPLFRDVVFGNSKEKTIELAVYGAEMFNKLADEFSAEGGEHFNFEYSPECFSQTEPDFAVEVCNAVITAWEGRDVIINLPFTVESYMPNVHADMIEYVCGKLKNRDKISVSLHAHNDRGTAVAATELCLLAGADRVEGTLFGNGERTGNADLITLAMNLYSQGIDTGLDFSKIDEAIALYERATCLPVHPRHPYAGELVYTAFSGSHQDAIRKGMAAKGDGFWQIPYLPIDPADVGRGYDPIIRVNSQSGSASTAYILEVKYGIHLPKAMQRDFGPVVTAFSDTNAAELSHEKIYELFTQTYVNRESPYRFVSKRDFIQDFEACSFACTMHYRGEEKLIRGRGHGVIDAFCQALNETYGVKFEIEHYSQHALDTTEGAKSRAITYVGITLNNKTYYGAGISRSTTNSALKAVVSALNNMQ